MGVVAIVPLVFVYFIARNGWRDFYWQGPEKHPRGQEVAKFLAFAALLAAIVFVATFVPFAGKSIYAGSFALAVAALNIGGLWLLSLLPRSRGVKPGFLASVLRMGTAFFVVYWFAFGEYLGQALKIRTSF